MPFCTPPRHLLAPMVLLAALTLGCGAVVGLPAAASTSASLESVAHWFSGKENRRVLLVSDGFHMLRLRIIATRLGLLPFTSPAPNSPIRSNPRRNAAYFLAEGFKVPVTWVFNR